MISIATVKKLGLSFKEAEELPHFEKTSFRFKKKIFATLDEKNNRVCLMLSLVDQSVFSVYDPTAVYPVPNAWGKKGATFVDLKKVRKDLFTDALSQAYIHVSEKATSRKRS